MTSFLIKTHETRPPSTWSSSPDCAFCQILKGESPATVVYENDLVIAFLDILPLRRGHTLVVPKAHYSRLSELPPEFASAIGEAVTKVAHALTVALDHTGLNVVCNQEYAQAVPHVHYHVIPAPKFDDPLSYSSTTQPLTQRQMHRLEFAGRSELDDDASALADQIRAKL
ncbi:unnamed protein product [Mycena citricolor]|uniref:HIT domain-containing protein n=1 Tax=Mycena citricolor TaxID=2018698 RepID=A0AAD2Q7E3_9AGAR|nr:unnamed protein product [Mycena citricolor]